MEHHYKELVKDQQEENSIAALKQNERINDLKKQVRM